MHFPTTGLPVTHLQMPKPLDRPPVGMLLQVITLKIPLPSPFSLFSHPVSFSSITGFSLWEEFNSKRCYNMASVPAIFHFHFSVQIFTSLRTSPILYVMLNHLTTDAEGYPGSTHYLICNTSSISKLPGKDPSQKGFDPSHADLSPVSWCWMFSSSWLLRLGLEGPTKKILLYFPARTEFVLYRVILAVSHIHPEETESLSCYQLE